jgi:hypothetical protein
MNLYPGKNKNQSQEGDTLVKQCDDLFVCFPFFSPALFSHAYVLVLSKNSPKGFIGKYKKDGDTTSGLFIIS